LTVKEIYMSRRKYDDFDSLFGGFPQDEDRFFGRMFKFGLLAWVLFILVDLALLVGLVFVAAHFLAKVW
jgi:hypothetical protein